MDGCSGLLQPEMLAQIDLSYAFIINDFLGFAGGQHRAVVDDVGTIADPQSLADVVVGDQDADFPILEEADDFLDIEHGDRVHAGERFVQQNEPRLRGESTGDLDAAALASRQADRRAVAQVRNVQIVQQRVESFADLVFLEFAQFQHRANVLRYGEFAEYGGLLRQVGQPHARAPMDRGVGQLLPVEIKTAAVE